MTLYVLTRGGFGNVLFNYIAAYSLGRKYSLRVVYINSYDPKRKRMVDYPIFKNELIVDRAESSTIIVKEQGFTYSELPYLLSSNTYLLDGYFQSYKYSQEYIQEIKKKLFPNYTYTISSPQTVMIHVRRGDYLNLQHVHPVQSDEYYSAAISKMISSIGKVRFMVFSDDVPFLKSWDVLKRLDCEIMETVDEIETFKLMMGCDHFIISNSSFSLLAYYFRNNHSGMICAPKKWFGPQGPVCNMDDLIEPGEHRILL